MRSGAPLGPTPGSSKPSVSATPADGGVRSTQRRTLQRDIAPDRSTSRVGDGLPLDLSSRITSGSLDLLRLRQEIEELRSKKGDAGRDEESLQTKLTTYELRAKRAALLDRVEPAAKAHLLESEDFAREFERERCDAYVVSIDIRRSTDLMLKARTPRDFARFLRNVCSALQDAVLLNHGVFDKFTGDGILAFFPEFYSGPDAGLHSLRAAGECHAAFAEVYHDHRDCFTTVRAGAGLGIGIDYGEVALVSDLGGLTVVGTPVVFACRLGATEAGTTVLNQQAHSAMRKRYADLYAFAECVVDFKNEGEFVGYRVESVSDSAQPLDPGWLAEYRAKQALGGQAQSK